MQALVGIIVLIGIAYLLSSEERGCPGNQLFLGFLSISHLPLSF